MVRLVAPSGIVRNAAAVSAPPTVGSGSGGSLRSAATSAHVPSAGTAKSRTPALGCSDGAATIQTWLPDSCRTRCSGRSGRPVTWAVNDAAAAEPWRSNARIGL